MNKQIREVRVKDILIYSVLSPIIIALIWTLTPLVFIRLVPFHPIYIYIIAGLLTYYPLKMSAIGAVLLYKALAPISVRESCRFVPTCSTYMVMAIKKYGLFIGIYKGFRRITRCKPPNGGVDYP